MGNLHHLSIKQNLDIAIPAVKHFSQTPEPLVDNVKAIPKPKPKTTYIQSKYLENSINKACPDSNNFLKFISTNYGEKNSIAIAKKFKIGNSNRWPGSTVFWQIDEELKIRSGQIMYYDIHTGSRNHKRNGWVHSTLLYKKIIKEFHLEQCLFGLHQINGFSSIELTKTTVAVVESAKTACIMSLFDNSCLWMSCRSMGELKYSKLKPLRKCKIILYPDLGINPDPFILWSNTAANLNKRGFNIAVSDLVLRNATDEQKKNKDDIADFFTRISKQN